MLGWHIDSVVKCGLAGTIFFSWTDEWFTGDQEITDWAFGIVTRDRDAEESVSHPARQARPRVTPRCRTARCRRAPFVSVIVCSYNGAKTLRRVPGVARQNRLPLLRSHARRRRLDRQHARDRRRLSARPLHPPGEPRPEPRAQHRRRRRARRDLCLHRLGLHGGQGLALLSDRHPTRRRLRRGRWPEHLAPGAAIGSRRASPRRRADRVTCCSPTPSRSTFPGCNMAWYRWAFENVGGFDVEYRKAGDDVDFCWRVQQAGHAIAFSPTAIVWHYRRFTLARLSRTNRKATARRNRCCVSST